MTYTITAELYGFFLSFGIYKPNNYFGLTFCRSVFNAVIRLMLEALWSVWVSASNMATLPLMPIAAFLWYPFRTAVPLEEPCKYVAISNRYRIHLAKMHTRVTDSYSQTRRETDRHNSQLQHMGALVQLVEYRSRNQEVADSTHTRSAASNLLCAQANSASYPQRDGIWIVATATGWRPSVADWGDGVSASCTVGPIGG